MHYVPGRDGQRFLVNMALDTEASPITVVVNRDTDEVTQRSTRPSSRSAVRGICSQSLRKGGMTA
jgi:hypothetical protein